MSDTTNDKQKLREELERELPHFTGSEEYTRLRYPWLRKDFLLTDGAKHLADRAKAYWLMDLIASHQTNKRVNTQPFQLWKIYVCTGESAQPDPRAILSMQTVLDFKSPNEERILEFQPDEQPTPAALVEWKKSARPGTALVICEDGNGNLLALQNIPYTDFPLDEIKLYVTNDDFNGIVVMLTSEY
jgi:hypothetical protein